MSWGSCQYEEAERIYNELSDNILKIRKFVKVKEIRKFDDIKADLIKDINENGSEVFEYEWKSITDIRDLDHAFEILRNMGWDLWSAVPYLAGHLLEYEIIKEPEVSIFGPELNQLVQSENGVTGVLAAILVQLKLVKDEDSFINFDT